MEPTTHRIARKLFLAKHPMLSTISLVAALGSIGMILTASEVRAQGRPESGRAEPVPRGPSDDSSALLDRARQKIASTTRRLLKCTCLETIERSYYAP